MSTFLLSACALSLVFFNYFGFKNDFTSTRIHFSDRYRFFNITAENQNALSSIEQEGDILSPRVYLPYLEPKGKLTRWMDNSQRPFSNTIAVADGEFFHYHNLFNALKGRLYGVQFYNGSLLVLKRGATAEENERVLRDIYGISDKTISIDGIRYGVSNGNIALRYENGIIHIIFEEDKFFKNVGLKIYDPSALNNYAYCTKPERDPEGMLCFGPYQEFSAGRYRAGFRLKSGYGRNDEDIFALIDVARKKGEKILAQKMLKGSDFDKKNRYINFYIDFTVEKKENLEFRILYKRKSRIYFDRVTVSKKIDQFEGE